MSLEVYNFLHRAAVSVIGIAFGTVIFGLFVRWSIVLTARMLRTATPQLGTHARCS